MTAYHKFLLKNRIYCEHQGCLMSLTHATKVVQRDGKELVFCDVHAARLEAAHKSDKQQQNQPTQTKIT